MSGRDHCFGGKWCFKNQKSLLMLHIVKLKEEYHGIMMVRFTKSFWWQFWLIGGQLVTITIYSTVVINKMVLQSVIANEISKRLNIRESSLRQARMYITESTTCSINLVLRQTGWIKLGVLVRRVSRQHLSIDAFTLKSLQK